MPPKMYLAGNTYGRLTVIKESEKRTGNRVHWECMCICGKIISVLATSLKRGNTQSCGCLREERRLNSVTIHGCSRSTKLKSEYLAWENMKSRCYYENNSYYHIYGGRGIRVCDRWKDSFENFIKDMGPKPSSKHSLDRFPDVNGDYGPNNCRWATLSQQARCRRANIWIEYKGENKILKDWARTLGVSYQSIQYHLKTKSFDEIYKRYYNAKK